MRQQCSGRIINAASEAWAGTVGHVNYGAAKGGIVSLTFSVAQEMGRYGVTCNAITPLAATRFTAGEEVKAGFKRRLEAGIITKEQYERLIDLPPPQSVPPLVVYLASEAAAGINGCVFGCGGGKITIWSHPKEARGIYKDYKQEGKWTQEELAKSLPTLLEENPNP
jgi:NAD(P)-dependent dehydrogenase (short-subunit alcohol dehydrogenase family)